MSREDEINNGFHESDWKLFRKKIIVWQENYMKELNEQYIKLLSRDKNPAENFWALDKRIKKDRKRIGVIIDMRRSTLITNMLELLNDNVIEMNDLDEFSDTLKETIMVFTNRQSITMKDK